MSVRLPARAIQLSSDLNAPARRVVTSPITVCDGTCVRFVRRLFWLATISPARETLALDALEQRPHSMWRYEEVLPDAPPVTLGEGMTPLIHARHLGGDLGLDALYIKEEGQNPTGSFKARGLSAAVSMAKALGVETIALPTAGNAGGAAAAYAAQAGLRVSSRCRPTRRRRSSSRRAPAVPTSG